MKKGLFFGIIITLLISLTSIYSFAKDVDLDNNDAMDIAFGGTNVTTGLGWDYTPLSTAPTLPVVGKIYCADNDNWDPIDYPGTTDYFVLWTGSSYIGIVDVDGNLLISTLLGDDTAYSASTWDNSTLPPTQNAVRDKFEAISGGTSALSTPDIGAATGTSVTLTGTIAGLLPLGSDITTGSNNITAAQTRGWLHRFTGAATAVLPTAASAGFGAAVCFKIRDAAEAAIVDVQAAEVLNLRGVPLSAGTGITATGAGEYVCLVSTTDADGSGTDGWETMGITSGWASQ